MKLTDIKYGAKVEGGRPYSEDFDQGTITAFDGDQVEVAWQSEIRTVQPASVLRLRWSNRWPKR
jgi:hypothetical protein